MQQRDSVISSRSTNARQRKIGGCPAYVAHKETAAIGDVFPRYFYYHATSWIGRQSDSAAFLRQTTLAMFAPRRRWRLSRAAAGAESHSRQARNKFSDRYHRFIIVTHSCGRLAVDNCRIMVSGGSGPRLTVSVRGGPTSSRVTKIMIRGIFQGFEGVKEGPRSRKKRENRFARIATRRWIQEFSLPARTWFLNHTIIAPAKQTNKGSLFKVSKDTFF